MTERHIPARPASAALRTDMYELTMLTSFIREGIADQHAVFEAFARRLPTGRRYGVVAGIGRLHDLIRDFRFTACELAWLEEAGIIDGPTRTWLTNFQFTGTIRTYAEGEIYLPGSPVVQVEGRLGEAVLLETLILSVLNHDCAIASAAARMVTAANGRPLIEMGSRRTHEDAATATARAAYLTGFTATSNLAAGYTYGIPTTGTAAHAFTLAHRSEKDAFAAQVAAHGPATSLLVDTYDIPTGIRNATAVAGPELGAVRIDSGDLGVEARKARDLLDELGNTSTRVIVTSDLDEYVMTALEDAPIDGYGAGTRVATGSGHPSAGFVYKLVAIEDDTDRMSPVAKRASGKVSHGGRKTAWRTYDATGTATGEYFRTTDTVTSDDEPVPAGTRALLVELVRNGGFTPQPSLETSRDFHGRVKAELPADALQIAHGEPPFTAVPADTPAPAGH